MSGIYIHIPLCKQKCGYCDFYSSTKVEYKAAVLERIRSELTKRSNYLDGTTLSTIYIGGGTPSLCSPAELQTLLDTIAGLWDCSKVSEITVEANPDDLSLPYLEELAAGVVNRLSIGVQSFIDRDLIFMNRRHNAQTAIDAVRRAQSTGFNNISIDLIYGIPGVSQSEWRSNIEQALELGVQHISAYHLTVEQNTPLGRELAAGKIKLVEEQVSREQYHLLCKMLAQEGFEQYEISNFALSGRRAIHNSAYWSGQSYLGVGPSSHSYNGKEREKCVASVSKYISSDSFDDLYEKETLTPADIYNEFVMTALRCTEGVNIEELERKFGSERLRDFIATAIQFIDVGTMLISGTQYKIDPREFLISDTVICEFFQE